MTEFEGLFTIEITAQNMQEVAVLARMALMGKRKGQDKYTFFPKTGSVSTTVTIHKRANANNYLRG